MGIASGMEGGADWAHQLVMRLFREKFPRRVLSPATRLDQLVFDSLDKVELVMELEDALATDLPDHPSEFVTIQDVIAWVRGIR